MTSVSPTDATATTTLHQRIQAFKKKNTQPLFDVCAKWTAEIKIRIEGEEHTILKRFARSEEPVRYAIFMNQFENDCRDAKVMDRVRYIFPEISKQLTVTLGMQVKVYPVHYFAMKEKIGLLPKKEAENDFASFGDLLCVELRVHPEK